MNETVHNKDSTAHVPQRCAVLVSQLLASFASLLPMSRYTRKRPHKKMTDRLIYFWVDRTALTQIPDSLFTGRTALNRIRYPLSFGWNFLALSSITYL